VPFLPTYLPLRASPQQSTPSIEIQFLQLTSQLLPKAFPSLASRNAFLSRQPPVRRKLSNNYLCSSPTPTAASRKASNFAPKDAAKATLDFRATISREDCCLRAVLLDWTTSGLLTPGRLVGFPRFVGREYRGILSWDACASYGTEMGPFFDRWVRMEMGPSLLWVLLV
jgi:hypothetical protein